MLVIGVDDFEFAQAKFALQGCLANRYLQVVQRLRAIAIGPPQCRIGN